MYSADIDSVSLAGSVLRVEKSKKIVKSAKRRELEFVIH